MKRVSWGSAPLTVAAAFLAFVIVGCGAKDEAIAETAAVKGEPGAVAAAEAPVEASAWLTSLDEGLAKAKIEKKMVLVDFGAEW